MKSASDNIADELFALAIMECAIKEAVRSFAERKESEDMHLIVLGGLEMICGKQL